MKSWIWISLLVSAFGFFKEFRPSEPFVTDYLIDYKNFTKSTIIHVVYPISTYTYLGTLPLVFLITDFLRYKSIIILEALAYVFCYILLIWSESLTALKIVEVLYGLSCSTEVAYYTYIYAKVKREHYKKVTSNSYTAILIGNFVAAISAQFLYSAKWMNFHELNYLTLASVSICLLIALFLPSVKKSIYFNRQSEENANDDKANTSRNENESKLGFIPRVLKAYPILWKDFREAYSNFYVLKWSIWWAISSAAFLQVLNYIQALWKEIKLSNYPVGTEIYNGAVDSVHTILSATLAIGVGYIKIPWSRWGEPFLCIMSLFQGLLLILMSQTKSLIIAYIGYILYRTFYQVMITVASAEVAQKISKDSYGLIFGINRFVSLILQTFLTITFSDEHGFALNERNQFLIYGIYSGGLGILFLIVVLYSIYVEKCKRNGNQNHVAHSNGFSNSIEMNTNTEFQVPS